MMPCAVAPRLACGIGLGALLVGCAAPLTRVETVAAGTVADAAFEVSGRLSARRGNEGAAANFRWSHAPGRDELVLSSPLGQSLARLDGDASGVRLDLPDGRSRQASDWEALTEDVLGAPVPVRGLAWWIRGVVHPRSAASIERDDAARAAVLRQDGWEIVYGYADGSADGNSRPARLTMRYPDTEIRLVVDAWSAAP